ncbi:hypothetical protein CU097_001546, partial [Rhizopus azygosporus]
ACHDEELVQGFDFILGDLLPYGRNSQKLRRKMMHHHRLCYLTSMIHKFSWYNWCEARHELVRQVKAPNALDVSSM